MEIQKFNARFPAILYARIQDEVKRRQADPSQWKFSINDWVVEAAHRMLDGGASGRQGVSLPEAVMAGGELPEPAELPVTNRRKTAAELAAEFGVKTGANIEEVALADERVPGASTQHKPSRDWGKFLAETDEMEPAEAKRAIALATEGKKVPPMLWRNTRAKQVAWLTENT